MYNDVEMVKVLGDSVEWPTLLIWPMPKVMGCRKSGKLVLYFSDEASPGKLKNCMVSNSVCREVDVGEEEGNATFSIMRATILLGRTLGEK